MTNNENSHLSIIFKEVLPFLANNGIRYSVFGGVAIAGIAGQFLRKNNDVDMYVPEESFNKAEELLKTLCAKHGSWDGDKWSLRYSILQTTKRPIIELHIKGTELLSIIPLYKVPNGYEFRMVRTLTLGNDALEVEIRRIRDFSFFSAPKKIITHLFIFMIEGSLDPRDHSKPLKENSKHMIDAQAILTAEQIKTFLETTPKN